jgi:hypothetical protein
MKEHTWGSVKRAYPSHREKGVGHESEKTRGVANPGVRGADRAPPVSTTSRGAIP